jgi:ABC-type phosphate transport system ATPase subunit
LARVVATEPDLLMLNELTADLDLSASAAGLSFGVGLRTALAR